MVKQPYFTSITRDSNNNWQTWGRQSERLLYSPLSIKAPFLWYLKLDKLHKKERSWNKDVMSQGIELGTSHTEGRTLTNCGWALALSEIVITNKNILTCAFQLMQRKHQQK